MRIKRIFTMALATAVLVQSLGTSAYAAGAATVPEGTVIETVAEDEAGSLEAEVSEEQSSGTESVVEESAAEQTTVSESETVTEEASEPETETVVETATEEVAETESSTVVEETTEAATSEAATSEAETTEAGTTEETTEEVTVEETMEETTEEAVDNQSGDYLIDTSLGVTLKDVTVNPGSYHVDVSWISLEDYSGDYSGYNVRLVYTDDAELAEKFFPDVTYASSSDISIGGYNTAYYTENSYKHLYWDDEGYVSGYDECCKWDTLYMPNDLKANTTYYYRLAQQHYDSELGGYVYKFLTVPGSFTTKAPVEKSAVTYKDIYIEETGYGTAKLVWSYENPDNEYINSSRYVYYADKDADFASDTYAYGQEYYDNKAYEYVENKFYAEIPLNSAEVKTKIQSKVYTGERVETPIESTETIINRAKIDTATITKSVDAGSASITAQTLVTPFYEVDNIYLYLYYRLKTEDNSNSYTTVNAQLVDGAAAVTVTGLNEKTDYEYYLEFHNQKGAVIWYDGSSEAPYTVNTSEVVTYEDSDFPDAVFREAVKSKAGIADGETITSTKLEKVTALSDLSLSSLGKEITSIEGIQYLKNLEEIDLNGQSVTDASQLKNLKKLKEIDLQNNDLIQMPDLSQLTLLRYLYVNHNVIVRSSITEDKLPSAFLSSNPDWIKSTREGQRKAFSYRMPDTFYAIGQQYPFFVYVEGIKGSRDYTLSVTIDGKTATTTSNLYGNDELVISDLSAAGIAMQPGKYTATISIVDEIGKEYVTNESVSFNVEADIAVLNEEKYVDSDDSTVYIYTYIPGSISESDVKSVELLDQSGNLMGTGSVDYRSVYYSDYRYDGYWPDLDCSMTYMSFEVTLARFLSSGDYDLKVTLTNGTEYDFENAVHVTGSPVITNVYTTNDYDNYGDYIHLSVTGYNLDMNKVYPVLYLDGEAITGEASAVRTYASTYIYKLKKINKETVWNDGFEGECNFKFVVADGYSVENRCSDDSISINLSGLVLFEHYNYKKQVYEVFLNSSLPEGTKVDVSICTSSSYNNVEATATATVKDNYLALSFVNANGDAYVPPKNVNKYFKYEYEVNGEKDSYTNQERIEWYNYSDSGSSSGGSYIYRHTTLYQESMMKELDIDIRIPKTLVDSEKDLQAQIYTNTGTPAGSAVTLSKSSTTIGGEAYFKYTGTWEDATGLSEGIYSISYLQDGVTVTSDTLYVYDNEKFYSYDQYASVLKDGTATIRFYSEKNYGNYINKYDGNVSNAKALEIWKDNYNLQVFDVKGNAITGWKIDSAYYNYSTMEAGISGLPTEYTGFYFRITDKNGNPAVRLSDGRIFYEVDSDSTVELGQWENVRNRSISVYGDSGTLHAYYGITTNYTDMFPVTLTFIRPYDAAVVKTVKVNNSTGSYYFTASDLSGISSNEVYKLIISAATGETNSYTGYFAVKGSSGGTVAATGITLDKTTLNMQLEETAQLSATVKPDNVTNSSVTWSSSDTKVATVDNTGKVTAVGTGTATITASTHNGKTATCTVNVYSYSISSGELKFDLSSENLTAALSISNGIANVTTVTWTSQDSSVASVDKNGTVTATGVGTTVIEGVVKDGPTLRCNVTVERSALEKITLSAESMELDKGKTAALTVYYVPNDVTCDKTVIWTSSDDAVATVDESGLVSAVAKGTAVITATVKDTDKSAQCSVKVFDTVEEELLVVPTGLTALTNVDKTLNHVSLEAFEGWKWQNPEIELAKFSGEQEKEFIAYYQKDEDTRPVYKAVAVKLSTVTGISVTAENASVLAGEGTKVNLTWNMTGNAYDMSEYEDRIIWKSANTSVATVSGNGISVSVNAVAKGKTTVEAAVEIDDKTYTAKANLSVLEGNRAQIDVTAVYGMTETAEGSGIFTGNKADLDVGSITVALKNAEKLTVKSNNAKVITVKNAVVNEDGTFSIPYEVKAAGTAKILLTANDALKTCKEIILQVKDVEPSVSVTAIKVNRLLKTGTSIDVYPGPDAAIKNVELVGTGKDNFIVTYDKAANTCSIMTVDEETPTGKYAELSLQVTFEDENIAVSPIPFVITVEEKKPSFKVKQSKKVNLFMDKDSEAAKLNITSSDAVASMKLENASDANFGFEIREENGEYFVAAKANGLTTKANKKGTLTVTFANYRGEYSSNFTVGLERKAPKITTDSKTYVLYPTVGINNAKIKLYINKEVFSVNSGNIRLEGTTDYDLAVENGYVVLTRTNAKQTGKVKATIKVTDSKWAEAVPVQVTLNVNMKTPKVKVSKTSIQLNPEYAAYDTASVKVMWKDGAVFDPYKVTVSAVNDASQAVLNKEIRFIVDGDQVIAKLNNIKSVKANYKFKVNVIPAKDAKEISANLTVKIVPMEMTKAVKVSAKGNIDVLNREGSSVTVTPSVKGINGKVVKAELAGVFAHLFDPTIKDNKVYIYAKDDANLITKYDYPVSLKLTLENEVGENIEVPAAVIKIKCKQGKPKVTATPKNAVFYSNAYNSKTIGLVATLKGAADPKIEKVELLNETKAFAYVYDAQTQEITVTMNGNGDVVKGKSYNLQFKVSFAGQADNEKATVIKYKVTVK